MLPFARRAVLCAAALAGLALPATALADCPDAATPAAGAAAQTATLCLLNAERAAHGLVALTADARLDAAARAHAADMAARRYFAHEAPDGGTLLGRLRTAGWLPATGAWSAGEDIAWGSGELATPARIVAGWMASPGHRANILERAFDEVGLGIASGAPQAGIPGTAATYVADFGSRADSSAAPPVARPAISRPATRCARIARRTVKKHTLRRCSRR